jgi:pilus assembly protein CpaC
MRRLALGVTLGAGMALGVHAETLHVPAGEQRVVGAPAAISNVAIGDPDIANVSAIDSRQVLVTGKAQGVTSLYVWTRGQRTPASYEVIVGSSVPHADAKLATDEAGAAPAAQVQADVKVVEVSRRALKQVGLLFAKNTGSSAIAIAPPGSFNGVEGGSGSLTFLSDTGFLPLSDAYTLLHGNPENGWFGVLNALEASGFAYTLAEPSLVALSGQSASFIAGGEFPVPVLQNTGGGGGSSGITVEFKQFGVRLTLTPTVLDARRIMLKVAPEVSELDFSAGITASGVTVPALRVRRTDTSIQLGDGESFVISGLISQSSLSSVDKIPFLGDLPILGAFFRSTRFDREDKELVMLVTPHLVQPIARDATLPTPPGERYRQYNPSFAQLYFNERGTFGASGGGFSD